MTDDDPTEPETDADLESRPPVLIGRGVVAAGGVTASFTPGSSTSLLTAYLRLIRSMRNQRRDPTILLRRDDIEAIAAHLGETGESVVDRLTGLMGATLSQRTAMVSMFAVGAAVIGLAGSASAMSSGDPQGVGSVQVRPAAMVASAGDHDALDELVELDEMTASMLAPIISSVSYDDGLQAAPEPPPATVAALTSPVSGEVHVAVGEPPVPGTSTPNVTAPAGDAPESTQADEPIVATDDPPVPAPESLPG